MGATVNHLSLFFLCWGWEGAFFFFVCMIACLLKGRGERSWKKGSVRLKMQI